MIACLLCKQEKLNKIRLRSKKGIELNITEIVTKHFLFLKPDVEGSKKVRICLVCWRIVREFHEFYQSVVEAHNYLECNGLNISSSHASATEVNETDPLPTLVKAENPLNTEFEFSDIKIELVDILQPTEVKVINANRNKSEIVTRVTRQSQRKLHHCNQDSSINESVENGPFDVENNDSELELPLSMLLHDSLRQSVASPTEQPKKRGRPARKVENNAKDEIILPELSPAKQEQNIEQDVDKKYELTTIEDEHFADDSNMPAIAEGECSESSDLSDFEPPERYADISTNEVQTKKKRKRIRGIYKRMTKEEIATKRLEQEKYDEIIATFFDNFPCPKCNLLVCTFGEMRKHFNKAHDGVTPYVLCCGRRFPMRKTLAEHVLVHSNPEHFKCLRCGQAFQDSSTLKHHERTHQADSSQPKQTFDCKICSKGFSSKYSLNEHIATKHKPKSEYEFVCKQCSRKFATKHQLRKHVRTHLPGGSVICDKCGKSLQTRTGLRRHIEIEHSDVPRKLPERVECPICKTSLCSAYTLKEHIKSMHQETTGESQEYRCEICGYLSVNARALKRHINYNHEKERTFQCTMCDKAFKSRYSLKEHISTHTRQGLNTCPDCFMTFACRANFHKHKQRRHGHQPAKRNLIGIAEKKRKKSKATLDAQATFPQNEFNE